MAVSRNIGPTVEILLKRVRQEGGLAVDVDLATKVYSYCERVTNTFTKRVKDSTALSVPKEKLIFNYRDEISDAIDIIEIRKSGARIEKLDTLFDLAAYNPDGFRKIDGTSFEAWIQVGKDILVLYPGQAAASSVDVTYSKLLTLHTDFTTSYNTASELPPEDIELALKLAEAVLLTSYRQNKAAQITLKKIAGELFGQ